MKNRALQSAYRRAFKRALTRKKLAKRWDCSERSIDRKLKDGLLPWFDLSGGTKARPTVRIWLDDIEKFELENRMDITEEQK